MPFEDFGAPIDLMSEGVLDKHGRAGPQPHGSPLFRDVPLVLENADHWMRRVGSNSVLLAFSNPANVARKFDRSDLHSKQRPR